MIIGVDLNYEEFKESQKDEKYLDGSYSCFVCGSKPAYYELGDARYYCAGCEKCAGIRKRFEQTVKRNMLKLGPMAKPSRGLRSTLAIYDDWRKCSTFDGGREYEEAEKRRQPHLSQ